MSDSFFDGLEKMKRDLEMLRDEGAVSIATAAACAAGGVLTNSIKAASPDELREKFGFSQVPAGEGRVRVVVGFGYGTAQPRRSAGKILTRPNMTNRTRVNQIASKGVTQGMASVPMAMQRAAASRADGLLNE